MSTPPGGTPAASAASASPAAVDDDVDPAQYDALRHGAGAYRLACDVRSVHGPDAATYLQGQCSQDLATLAVGGAAPSLVLEPDGKLCALVSVARRAEDDFVLATHAGWGERLEARLRRFRLRAKLDIDALDWSCVAVRGAGAVAPAGVPDGVPDGVPEGVPDGVPEGVVVPVALGAWVGFDLFGPTPDASPALAEVTWCDGAAFACWRIESGVPVMGHELDERTIAPEAGLVDWAVSLTKGCYTGQELVARLDARGNKVARRLCGLVVRPGGPVGAALPAPSVMVGAPLHAGDKAVGVVTSATRSPSLGLAALAYVHRSVEQGAVIDVATAGDDRWAAEVRSLPMVSGPGPGAPR